MRQYVVVTIEGVPSRPASGGLQSVLGGSTLDFGAAAGTAKLAVSTTVMSDSQAAEASRDPRNTVAEDFPVVQIAPYEAAGDAAAPVQGPAWGLAAVGADAAPPSAGTGVVVAVLDTGLAEKHSCFPETEITIERKNFVPGSSEYDVRGHGTHCASTIFGRDVGGTRVGIARGVTRALIGKVFDDKGRTSTAAVVAALQWAHAQGAHIVSMSLGFDFVALREGLREHGLSEQAATSRALKQYREVLRQFDALINFMSLESMTAPGMLLVAAAGNESRRTAIQPYEIDVSMPAASDNVISVAALMQKAGALAPAPYSNTGATLAAPGSGILGASHEGGFVTKDGTSMACPHVAGVAALWWEQFVKDNGYASARSIAAEMLAGTQRLPDLPVSQRGRGLVRSPRYQAVV